MDRDIRIDKVSKHYGKLVAVKEVSLTVRSGSAGTPKQLKDTAENASYYEIAVGDSENYLRVFQGLPFVAGSSMEDGQIRLALKKDGTLGGVVERIKPRDLKKISSRQPSLEDIFLKLTGRGLRQ